MSRKIPTTVLAAIMMTFATSAVAGGPLWNYDDTFVEGEWNTTLSTDTLPRDMDEYSRATFEPGEDTVHGDYPGCRVIVDMDPGDTDEAIVVHFPFLEGK